MPRTLNDLPNELIQDLSILVHPQDIVNFATTCSRFYHLSDLALEIHRNYQETLTQVTDEDPTVISKVWDMIVEDPRATWYIRRLVVYGDMCDFLTAPEGERGEEQRQTQRQKWPISEEENLEDVWRILVEKHDKINGLYESTLIPQDALNNDDLRKLIIVALAPRLQIVIVTAYMDLYHSRPLHELMGEAIRWYLSQPAEGRAWPAGFTSMTELHLNHWLESRHPHDQVHIPSEKATTYLMLPSLRHLAFGTAGFDSDEDFFDYDFEPRSSTVETLDLGLAELDSDQASSVLRVTNNLKAYRRRYGCDLPELSNTSNTTLEYLSVGRRTPEVPKDILLHFESLKSLKLGLEDWFPNHEDLESVEQKNGAPYPLRLENILPKSIERLCFDHAYPVWSSSWQSLGKAVEEITRWVSRKDEYSPNLTCLCLYGVAHFVEYRKEWVENEGNWKDASFVKELQAVCRTKNVKLEAGFDLQKIDCKVCSGLLDMYKLGPRELVGGGRDRLEYRPCWW